MELVKTIPSNGNGHVRGEDQPLEDFVRINFNSKTFFEEVVLRLKKQKYTQFNLWKNQSGEEYWVFSNLDPDNSKAMLIGPKGPACLTKRGKRYSSFELELTRAGYQRLQVKAI